MAGMERAEDFEIPPPKRSRLDAQESGISHSPNTAMDDMDDLYNEPSIHTTSPLSNPQLHAPVSDRVSSPPMQKSPQLPGLGVIYDNQQSPNEAAQPKLHALDSVVASESAVITEKDLKHVIVGQEQVVQNEAEPTIAVEAKTNGDGKYAISKIAATTGGAPPTNGNNAKDARQQIQSEEQSKPAQGQEETLDTKLQQATIKSQSPEHGAVSDATVDLQSADADLTPTGEAQPVLGGTETALDGKINNESSGLEWKKALDPTLAVASTEPTFKELAEATKSNEDAEFELDSSPLCSSSSDTSSVTSSSDDDSDAEDYEMLGPEEQARRLMAEDGGSDDGRPSKGSNAAAGVLRTTNEKPDEIVPKPDITVTADMKIDELGRVENLVENLALIKANTSGEYQVLESGSVICLENRSVIGIIAETLGRVQQPYYSVRFTNAAAITEAGISQDTRVFYVGDHSSTVFTQPLKAFKGSDASNLHDEEVGDDELEFSDDEAEAEHKRQVKLQKRARHGARDGQADGVSRGPQHRPGGPNNQYRHGLHSWPEHLPGSMDLSLNYDDADGPDARNEDNDELYTPLPRPSNFHEMLAGKPLSMDTRTSHGNAHRAGRGGSRVGRQRHRGNRGNRGQDRGGKYNRREHANPRESRPPHEGQNSPLMTQSNVVSLSAQNHLPPRPSHQNNGNGPPSNKGIGYQPQQSPIQPLNYPIQPQANSYPGYPSQYPNNYKQSYPQPQQSQGYHSQFPEQYNSQYYQPPQSSPQSYRPQQTLPPHAQYATHQTSTMPTPPAHIPPGAHINPSFFQQQAQSQPQAWQQPESKASLRVQESLNVLKGFRGGGYAPQ